MKTDYSKFICWKEKIYAELFRALRMNDKKSLPPEKETNKSS